MLYWSRVNRVPEAFFRRQSSERRRREVKSRVEAWGQTRSSFSTAARISRLGDVHVSGRGLDVAVRHEFLNDREGDAGLVEPRGERGPEHGREDPPGDARVAGRRSCLVLDGPRMGGRLRANSNPQAPRHAMGEMLRWLNPCPVTRHAPKQWRRRQTTPCTAWRVVTYGPGDWRGIQPACSIGPRCPGRNALHWGVSASFKLTQ